MINALTGLSIAYITGVFITLGFVLSATPISKSGKPKASGIIITILGSWFSIGIFLGLIVDYLQEISDDINSSTHRR